jgi:hypothetical protein
MGFEPVELEAWGEGAPELPQLLQGRFPSWVAAYLKLSGAGDSHLDIVAFLEFQRVHNCGGQPDGKAISPF